MATTAEDVWQLLAELTAAQKETDLILKEVSQQQRENAEQQKATDRQLKELGKQTDHPFLILTFPVKCGLQAASLGKGHATSTNRAKELGYREEFYDDVQDNPLETKFIRLNRKNIISTQMKLRSEK